MAFFMVKQQGKSEETTCFQAIKTARQQYL